MNVEVKAPRAKIKHLPDRATFIYPDISDPQYVYLKVPKYSSNGEEEPKPITSSGY
jgi:hypothetical protein